MTATTLLATALVAASGVAQTAPPDTVRGERVSVVFWDGLTERARALVVDLESQPPLPGLPDDVPTGVTLFLADSEARLDSLVGDALPEWSAALAFPERRTIVLPTYASNRTLGGDRAVTLRHEWAHVALGDYLEGLRVPRWFHEGYARHAALEWDAAAGWRLRLALLTGAAPSLDSLSLSWPSEANRSGLAYDLAASAYEFLVRAGGEPGLTQFFETWREQQSFDTALRRVYGYTPGRFETLWLRSVKRRYGWLLIASQSVTLWLGLAAVLLLLWRWRARRMRDRMAQLRATEPPDQPAFWAPDPRPGSPDSPNSSTENG